VEKLKIGQVVLNSKRRHLGRGSYDMYSTTLDDADENTDVDECCCEDMGYYKKKSHCNYACFDCIRLPSSDFEHYTDRSDEDEDD